MGQILKAATAPNADPESNGFSSTDSQCGGWSDNTRGNHYVNNGL